jgi:hypothetical protein
MMPSADELPFVTVIGGLALGLLWIACWSYQLFDNRRTAAAQRDRVTAKRRAAEQAEQLSRQYAAAEGANAARVLARARERGSAAEEAVPARATGPTRPPRRRR